MRHSGERSQFDEWLADIDVSRVMWIILFVILGLIIAWGIFTSYYTVQPEGQAVVKRFGKVIAIKDPGLHFKIPFGIDEQEFVPTARVLKQEFGFRTAAQEGTSAVYRKSEEHRDESLMLTGDLKVVDVEWVVQYRVDDPDKYLHRVEQVDKTIRDISEAVMRRIVGNNLGSDVLTIKRVEIALNAKEEIQRLLDSFDMGVRIGTVELQDVNPPDSVKPAFNEVNQAEQEKEQLINEAEKKQNQQIPAARGKAKQVVATAEGYRAERVNGALGETSRFKAILKEYKVAPEVTRRRMYLETLDKVLPSLGKIYIIEPGGQSPIPLLNLDKNSSAQNR